MLSCFTSTSTLMMLSGYSNLHNTKNSIIEISETGLQLLEWEVALQLYVWWYVPVWGKSCVWWYAPVWGKSHVCGGMHQCGETVVCMVVCPSVVKQSCVWWYAPVWGNSRVYGGLPQTILTFKHNFCE